MGAENDYLKVYKERFEDWSGGMRDEVRGTLLKDNQAQILYDVSFDQRGTLYPCNGHVKRYATNQGTAKIDGLGYYEKANGKQYLIVAIDTKLYYDDLSISPAALVEIVGTFTASDTWDFTVLNDVLYIVNGKDKLKTWNGTTLTDLSVPIPQVETATVEGTITTAGNAKVIVTANGMANSPKTVSVAVALNDDAGTVAGKIRTALGADAEISSFFTVSGATVSVILTVKMAVANDSTLNVSVNNDTCAGLTAKSTSENTTAGFVGVLYTFSHVEAHSNMLWGAEASTSRVRWSAILDGSSWDALHCIDFNPSDGDYIRRIIRYQSYLAVQKRKSKAIITGDRTSNYATSWLEGYGTVSTDAVAIAERYIAYVAMDGVRVTDLTNDILISLQLTDSWNRRVNKAALHKVAMVYWRNYILVSLPVGTSAENNEVWCYDMRYNSWVILRNLNISCWTKAFIGSDEILFGGDSTTGQLIQVLKYDELHYPDGYNLVEYDWLSKEWTLEEPERYKLFKNIYLELEGVEELSRVNMWMYVDDVEYEVSSEAIDVPDGVGKYRHVRLIPPIYGAVLGRKLSVRLKGRVGVRSIVIEYSLRSNISPGGVI